MTCTAEAAAQQTQAADLPVFTPQADIFEKENTLYIVTEMPGVRDDDLEVTIDDNILQLIGHQTVTDFDQHTLKHQGYRQGVYKRKFKLMENIDQQNVKARIANGILTVELPKAEKEHPKQIRINLN